jgi:hypothetical protein
VFFSGSGAHPSLPLPGALALLGSFRVSHEALLHSCFQVASLEDPRRCDPGPGLAPSVFLFLLV